MRLRRKNATKAAAQPQRVQDVNLTAAELCQAVDLKRDARRR